MTSEYYLKAIRIGIQNINEKHMMLQIDELKIESVIEAKKAKNVNTKGVAQRLKRAY